MSLKPIASATRDTPEIPDPLCAVFRRHLKSVGQKYTPERAQVLDTLARLGDVFEAEQLQAALKRDGFRVSKATTYRTIKLLLEAGIIQKVFMDSEQAHYQLAWGRQPRDLLVRMDTSEITPIDVPELKALCERLCKEKGLKSRGHRLVIYAVK